MRQILVHCGRDAIHVALLENAQLVEYYAERPKEGQAGSIFKGRVVNVLPGMQAAFVDIGQTRNAFLYVDDLLEANLEKQPPVKPSIANLVREGQEIIVQVAREATGGKGAKITTHFSLPGRWLVYMPCADYIGISRKIESAEERARLREIGERLRDADEGLIMRTVAEGASVEELEKDLAELRQLWASIQTRGGKAEAPACLFSDLDMLPRLVRDLFSDQVDELWIDDGEKLEDIRSLLQQYAPNLVDRVRLYTGPEPMMRARGIGEALEKSFRPKVWLDNGGYLIIDHTEALTVIDVNTGKFTGSVDLEQTVFETNLAAAAEIARLIRLKDIGGIIIVDFIDMASENHRSAVVEHIEQRLKADRTKTIVVGWTQLGLLEITRKKVRAGARRPQDEACPHCGGTGKRLANRL